MNKSWLNGLVFSKFLYFLCIILISLLYGLYNYIFISEPNRCQMTFMYQFPEFIPVKLNSQVSKKFPKYNLYIYGEGGYADFLRFGEDNLFGNPVLFVPGSGGSYKQVRSFGSVALRMAEDKLLPYHLNFFTLDFNEDLSALYGPKLEEQTEFLFEAISAIKRLYRNSKQKASLIIIGHSIGGLISRGVFTQKKFNPKCIDLLITLSVPHKRPAVYFDSATYKYYQKVASYWKQHRNSSELAHLSIISLGGGFDDKLVKSELTQFDDMSPSLGDIHAVTTAISDVWLSTDHQCIVWCRQLIVKLTNLIYEMKDPKRHRVDSDVRYRIQTINYHLVNRNRGPTRNQVIPESIEFSKRGNWLFYGERFFTFRRPKLLMEPTHLMIPLVPKTNIVIVTSNIRKHDWLFACNSTLARVNETSQRTCETGLNLTPSTRLIHKISEAGGERKFFKQETTKLVSAGFDHLVVNIGPTSGTVSVIGERFGFNKRQKAIILPSIFHGLLFFWSTPSVVLNIHVSDESIFHNLTLVGFNQIWHCYDLTVEVQSCYPNAFEHSLVHFWIPWSREDIIQQIEPIKGRSANMNLRLNIPKTDLNDPRHPHLYLVLEPNCGYLVKLKLSLFEVITQVIRHYFNNYLPLISAILLAAFSIQSIPVPKSSILKPLPDEKFFKEPQSKVFLPLTKILHSSPLKVSLYGLITIQPIFISKIMDVISLWSVKTPSTLNPYNINHLSLEQQIFLNIFLYLSAYAIVFSIGLLLELLVHIFSLLLFNGFALLPDSLMSKFERNDSEKNLSLRTFFFSMLIFIITSLTCSTIGLALLLIYFLGKSICLSVKSKILESRTGPSEESTFYCLYMTLFLILNAAAVPTIPSFLVWYKDYFSLDFSSKNFPDPFFHATSIVAFSSGLVLQLEQERFVFGKFLIFSSLTFKFSAIFTYGFGLMAYDSITMLFSLAIAGYAIYLFYCKFCKKSNLKRE